MAGENHTFPIGQAEDFILKFSDKGKPVLEGGPVHILFKDGSNIHHPIRSVNAIRID
jgi:hypothetical protein